MADRYSTITREHRHKRLVGGRWTIEPCPGPAKPPVPPVIQIARRRNVR